MTEIYLAHHVANAFSLSKKDESSVSIAEKIFQNERMAGKAVPADPEEYKKAIADSIEKIRAGIKLENIGIDFPDTGFETDPICRVCRACQMRDEDEVEELLAKINS